MFSYFAKILKSLKYQSVLKVYYLTKNRQKRAKSPNIRKLQIADYQYNIFFWFLLFLRYCTGSGYDKNSKLFIFKHLTLFLFKIVPILFPVILNTNDIRLTGCRVFIQQLRYYISKKQYTYYSLNMIYSYEALLQRHSPR